MLRYWNSTNRLWVSLGSMEASNIYIYIYREVNCCKGWSLCVADQKTTQKILSSKWTSATRPSQTTSPTLPPLHILLPYLIHPPLKDSPTYPTLLPQRWGPLLVQICNQNNLPLLLVSLISMVVPRQLNIYTLGPTRVITTWAT